MTDSTQYQPKDAKDALRFVQDLFNQYNQAPLTDELIAYHQKLLAYLTNDITQELLQHPNTAQTKNLESLTVAMQDWLKLRLNGKPYLGKLQHFTFVSTQQHTKFQHRSVKGSRPGQVRTSPRH